MIRLNLLGPFQAQMAERPLAHFGTIREQALLVYLAVEWERAQTSAVRAFDFDMERGTIRNERTAILVPEEMGYPDGMTIDAEGMLWIALWGGGQAGRWNPHNGKLLHSIPCPASQTTACAFGGKELDTLYITSAAVDLSEEQLKKEPHAGGLFAVRPGCQGIAAYRFGG